MPNANVSNPAQLSLFNTPLPDQGGIYWYMAGLPAKGLPAPCVECLKFIAQMTDGELVALRERAILQFVPN